MNKIKLLIGCFFIVSFFSFNSFTSNESIVNDTELKDRCLDWNRVSSSGPHKYVYLKICENSTGKSGYYKFKNTRNIPVRISYTIYFRNGKKFNGSTKIKANSISDRRSCYNCNSVNGGAKSWEITKIAFQGQKGYW